MKSFSIQVAGKPFFCLLHGGVTYKYYDGIRLLKLFFLKTLCIYIVECEYDEKQIERINRVFHLCKINLLLIPAEIVIISVGILKLDHPFFSLSVHMM